MMSDQAPGSSEQERMPESLRPIPDMPPTPGIPQIPDTPDMPDLPNMPDLPDTSDNPEMPGDPDLPNFPDPSTYPPERLPEEPEPPEMVVYPDLLRVDLGSATPDLTEPEAQPAEVEPVFTLNDLRIEALTRAIARYPQTPINYLLRGELYLSLNLIEAAATDFERALTLAADEFESLTWGYANTALIDRAQDGLRQVAHHQPIAPVASLPEPLSDPV